MLNRAMNVRDNGGSRPYTSLAIDTESEPKPRPGLDLTGSVGGRTNPRPGSRDRLSGAAEDRLPLGRRIRTVQEIEHF